MNHFISLAFLFAVLIFSPFATAGLFSASTYDDCIIDSMKGVTSDVAAKAIKESCKKKFPAPEDMPLASNTLTQKEIGKLRMECNFLTHSMPNTFGCHAYNGNPDFIITEITIGFSKAGEKQAGEHLYVAKVNVLPLTTSFASFDTLGVPQGYNYYVQSVRGAMRAR